MGNYSQKNNACRCVWGVWTRGVLSITQCHFSLSPSCNYTKQWDGLIVIQQSTSWKDQRAGWRICHIAKFSSDKQEGKGEREKGLERGIIRLISAWTEYRRWELGSLRWLLLPRSGGICSAGTYRSVHTISCNKQKLEM